MRHLPFEAPLRVIEEQIEQLGWRSEELNLDLSDEIEAARIKLKEHEDPLDTSKKPARPQGGLMRGVQDPKAPQGHHTL